MSLQRTCSSDLTQGRAEARRRERVRITRPRTAQLVGIDGQILLHASPPSTTCVSLSVQLRTPTISRSLLQHLRMACAHSAFPSERGPHVLKLQVSWDGRMMERPFQAQLARRLDLSTVHARLKVIYLYAIMLLCGASISRGQNANFTITDFSKDMSLSGTCLVDGGTGNQLWMTAARNGSPNISAAVDNACKAVYSTKLRIYDPIAGLATSWNTSFTFTIQPEVGALPGEYVAFAITANKTVGTPSTAGLYDDNVLKPGGNLKIQAVAVRFFTYWNNVSLLVNDKEDHMGRNWNLDKYNVSLNKAYDRMRTYQAWIDYDAALKTMDFYIVALDVTSTKSVASRVFSENLDLSNSSTRPGLVPSDSYIGFTAATTTNDRQIPEVISWQFSHRASSSLVLVTPTPTSTRRTSSKSSNLGLVVGVCIGAALFVLVLLVIAIVVMRRKKKSSHQKVELSSPHLDAVNFGPRRLSYAELRVATNNFSDERLLGKGGFGSVYEGSLPGSKENEEVLVAIKKISPDSTQGEREFKAEVLSIGRLRHRNLVPLLGWCHEQEELLLVYEFMANGSLDQHLYSQKGNATLSWESRFQILKSVAAALDYLHNGWEKCILHRDIKPSNVMLDLQMNARLGDFGLARLAIHGQENETVVMSHLTNVVGTAGYIAPVSNCFQASTIKTDVYSFGMMALEVVCGRRPLIPGEEEESLVTWVWKMHKKGQLLDVTDASLQMKSQLKSDEVARVLHLGMLCTMPDPSLRPRTERLLQALKGDWSVSLPASRTGLSSLPMSLTSSTYNTSSSQSILLSDDRV